MVRHQRKIAVIGLGYVGLPVAVAFARSGAAVIGFDVDRNRIDELRAGVDRTREVEKSDLAHPTLVYTGDPAALAAADFYIVTVPTPIDAARRPDLSAMFAASDTVGRFLKRGDIVVYEFHRLSRRGRRGLRAAPGARLGACSCGVDFTVGYSPERINPGDKNHRFETITKVVSGQDEKTLAHRRRRLRFGGHRRHPLRALDQSGRGGQGHREYPARPQYRVHERAVRAVRAFGHRHRRRARRRGDQMEFPEVLSGTGRRPLHRRRSLLSDLSRRKGRLRSAGHLGRPQNQRRCRPTRRARMRAPAAQARQRRRRWSPCWA